MEFKKQCLERFEKLGYSIYATSNNDKKVILYNYKHLGQGYPDIHCEINKIGETKITLVSNLALFFELKSISIDWNYIGIEKLIARMKHYIQICEDNKI